MTAVRLQLERGLSMWPRVSLVGSLFIAMMAIVLFSIIYSPYYRGKTPRNGDTGILVLAHGGSFEWNKAVKDAVKNVRGDFKKEIAFGMADAQTVQPAIDRLEKLGVKKIIGIPLFLSSSSEMFRQLEYVLGLRDEPDVLFTALMKERTAKENHHAGADHSIMLEHARFSVPFVLAKAIDYDPLVTSILAERIKELNLTFDNLSVFLIAHGPVSEEDNKSWLRDLRFYARYLSKQFKGISVLVHTIRDDAPNFIKEMTQEIIKGKILEEKGKGREVAVIPFLLAPGGREEELKRIFSECKCRILGKTLLPHPNITLWIEQQIKEKR